MSENGVPSKEEWAAWLEQPETQFIRQLAKKRREEIKELWENGGFRNQLDNFTAIGGCKALQLLEDMSYEEVVENELGEVNGNSEPKIHGRPYDPEYDS